MSNPVMKSRPTRAATIASMRNKKMTAVAEDSDDSFDGAGEVIDASDEDVEPAPSTRGRKRPAPAPTKTPKRKAAKPPSGRAARSTRAATAVDDDSGDDVDEIVAPSRTRATRTASGMTQGGTQSTWGRSRR